MSDAGTNNQGELPVAALLRLAADGELTAEQEAQLRAHLEACPEDEQRIEFERRLRAACGCACAPDCCAPAGLRERVLACCEEPAVVDGLAARAGQTRNKSFWAGRMVVRFGAVAALITLVAIMSFMVGRTGSPGSGPGAVSQDVLLSQVASYVRNEHNRCEDMADGEGAKFTIAGADEVEPAFEGLAGRDISLATIVEASEKGLHFVDGGKCHLPGGGVAMHLRFSVDDSADPDVSVWAAVDTSLDLVEGETYVTGEGDQRVRIWRVGEVRYVLVGSTAGCCATAAGALGCPSQTRPSSTP